MKPSKGLSGGGHPARDHLRRRSRSLPAGECTGRAGIDEVVLRRGRLRVRGRTRPGDRREGSRGEVPLYRRRGHPSRASGDPIMWRRCSRSRSRFPGSGPSASCRTTSTPSSGTRTSAKLSARTSPTTCARISGSCRAATQSIHARSRGASTTTRYSLRCSAEGWESRRIPTSCSRCCACIPARTGSRSTNGWRPTPSFQKELQDALRKADQPEAVYLKGERLPLPADLTNYLRGRATAVLEAENLQAYVSAAESTWSIDPWVLEARIEVEPHPASRGRVGRRSNVPQARPSGRSRDHVDRLYGLIGTRRESSGWLGVLRRDLDRAVSRLMAIASELEAEVAEGGASASRWNSEAVPQLDKLDAGLLAWHRYIGLGP